MMHQLYTEEQVRSQAASGIKQTRTSSLGPRNYFSGSFANSRSVNAIYDRAQEGGTLGMGEVSVVLNGVEFRTSKNDYTLTTPHSTSTAFGDTEALQYPDVPDAVTNLATVEEQIAEMRLWFKAW